MASSGQTRSFRADGNIPVCTFVSPSTDDPSSIKAATGATPIMGVSVEGAYNAPLPHVTTDPELAAADGGSCAILQYGTIPVRAGGVITSGARIIAHTDGTALVAAGTADTVEYLAGFAAGPAASGEVFNVHFFPQIVLNPSA